MSSLDLDRWAIVGVKDETGVGRMSQDLKRALDPIRHLVVPSYRHVSKPIAKNDIPLAFDVGDDAVREQLCSMQGIIICEDTEWPLRIIPLAHQMGVKVVFIILWEWFRFYIPEFKQCDLFICLHGFAERIAHSFGFDNTARATWPLNIPALPHRAITGPARTFVHNVGLFEKDDRKGTRIALKAFEKVARSDIKLVVRVQNAFDEPLTDPRVSCDARHLEHHGDLYRMGDVAVQPSKCEGIGFMLLEAIASGLPVISTNYPPMNEYIRHERLLVSTRWGKYPAQQTSYIAHAHFKIPRVSSLAKSIAWCADNDLSEISAANRAWAEETFQEQKVRKEWMDALKKTLH